jgi:hypothetical protein
MFICVRQGKDLTQTLPKVVYLQSAAFKEIRNNLLGNGINFKDERHPSEQIYPYSNLNVITF